MEFRVKWQVSLVSLPLYSRLFFYFSFLLSLQVQTSFMSTILISLQLLSFAVLKEPTHQISRYKPNPLIPMTIDTIQLSPFLHKATPIL
jgi:uncharacterized membrane protein (UPF0136 family)